MTDARMGKLGESGLAASNIAAPDVGDSDVGARLNALLAIARLEPVDAATAARFASYLALLLKWNSKINLTAVRDEEGILARHFVESIACARALPAGIQSLLDYGSGAGLPGIPIALCRPEMRVTLAEAQSKKAAFLGEAVRVLGIEARVHAGRAEELTERFDGVTLRAVDRMSEAVRAAGMLLREGGWLAVMTTGKEAGGVKAAAGSGFRWADGVKLPGGADRVLVMGALEAGTS
jgi:16S rRNA (guanine527-N7)-methyltransferase